MGDVSPITTRLSSSSEQPFRESLTMKTATTLLTLIAALFCGLAAGCADTPNPVGSPITTPDSGDAAPGDTNPTTDQAVAVDGGDAGTSDDVAPSDAATDAPPLCEESREPSGSVYCAGNVTCVPNLYNAACASASACSCDMDNPLLVQPFDPVICTPGTNMAACRAATTCTPGHNHCSPNLPAGVEYAPFRWLGTPGRFDGLLGTRTRGWIATDGSGRLTSFESGAGGYGAVYNSRGFVQVCMSISGWPGIPSSMEGRMACATCVDITCYWNRGPVELRANLPSFEIEFESNACGFNFRYYDPGSDTPNPDESGNFSSQSPC